MFLVSVNEMDKSCERDGGELCQTFFRENKLERII
jgi:hypothetical protein